MTIRVPEFVESRSGKLFVLKFKPPSPPRGLILFVPPFLEEMNRCRSLVAQQAEYFCAQGYGCILVDLFGTGESEGLLTDASWSIWRDNILDVINWDRSTSGAEIPIVLWGLRLGCLLAADVAKDSPELFRRLLFWQPVLDGKIYITQVLRQRIAHLMGHGLPQETTNEMRSRLSSGGNVEVSGYNLSPKLVEGIDNVGLSEMPSLKSVTIDWLEHVSSQDKEIGVAASKCVTTLRAQHNSVEVSKFVSPQIWHLNQRDEAPDLHAKTNKVSVV